MQYNLDKQVQEVSFETVPRLQTDLIALTCTGWDIVARKQYKLGPRCF